MILFTNPPVLIVKPVTMNGKNPAGVTYQALPGTGGPTITPLNNNPDKGFRFTDFEISYTTVEGDIPKEGAIPQIGITWAVQRTFTYTTGVYETTSSLDGSVVVPAGGKVNAISLSTFWGATVPPPAETVAEVAVGPFNKNSNFKDTKTSAPFMRVQQGADPEKEILVQEGLITFTPSAVDQTFTFDFPMSALSTVGVVPEPGTLVMTITSALVWTFVALRRRRLPPRGEDAP